MSREMKDSGVAWIGEIPKGWGVSRLKNLFRIKKNIAGQEGYDVLSVTQKGIKIKDLTKNEGQLAKDYSNYQLVEKNDFVMNHMDLLTGYVDCSNFMGVTSPDYRVFYCVDNKTTNREYYLYILQACYTNKIFYGLGQGVSGFGRWRLPADQFLLFELPIPSFSEQQIITNYLDEKCAEIDNLISLLEEMIGELKAYKQSVITEAVCKGLNKNVPMKDSGIEWIGEIPEHWIALQVRNIIKVSSSKRVFEESYQDDGIPFYRSKEITELSEDSECNPTIFISRELFEKVNILSPSPKKGDILLTSIGTIGKTWISDGREFYYKDGNLTQLSIEDNADAKYVNYCFKSSVIFKQYEMLSVGSTLLALTIHKISRLTLTFPPLSEQQSIANYLDEKCGNIEGLIAIKQAKIDELKEYKKSLIYEYVTGKKSVI